MTSHINIIERYFEERNTLSPETASSELVNVVNDTIADLDAGHLRVAEKINSAWVVHQWVKKAILLAFRLYPNHVNDAGFCQFYDKIPLKYTDFTEENFAQAGVRIVPHAIVRRGAFIGKNTILMPSYVNIGAYVD